jgi:hypothetical protein
MKPLLIIVFVFNLFDVLGQETDSPFYLQQPIQYNEVELRKALDSLALQQLNSKYFQKSLNNFDNSQFLLSDSATARKADSIRMKVLFGTYEDFKRKFLALELPAENPNLNFSRLPKFNSRLNDADFEGQVGFSFTGPASLLYSAFSKQEQSIKKYQAIKKYEPKQKIINAKYNAQKVQYVTGLKGDKLTKFVLYCHFSNDYLLDVSEYELIDVILKKLLEFKAKEDSVNYSN